MATILLIDDALFCRELVGKALRQEGYEVITAVNGRDGLLALKLNTVQLVILDNEMPLMDGPAFLQQIRENPNWIKLPVIMLTGVAQKEKVLEAIQFGAVEYLLKSAFSLSKLLECVRKRLPSDSSNGGPGVDHLSISGSRETTPIPMARSVPAGPGVRPISSPREQVIAAIDSIEDARTLGGVVGRVLAIANSPRAGLRDLVQVVQQDPVLSTRTLRLANSAAFSSHRPPVTTIEDAVRHVGAGAVRTLAMSLGVFETLSSDGTLSLGLIRCWQHALAVAGLMDKISARADTILSEKRDSGVGHLVGLCHDLGEILLRQRFPSAFAEAEQKALASEVSVYRVLPETFGMSFDEVTERLLAKLCVPATISQPILEYARCEADMKNSCAPIARLLSLADRYANGLLFASSVTAMISPILFSEHPGILPIDNDSLRQEVLATTCAMAELAAAEEEELLRPLLPRQSLRLFYVRDRSLSAFDPIENALKAISQAEIVDPISALAEQRAGQPIVVVATPRLDTPPYSSLAKCSPGNSQLYRGFGLFLVGNAVNVDLPNDSSRVCHRYPISLYALNELLQRSRARQTAA